MADALFTFFDSILGSDFQRTSRLNLDELGVPSADLTGLKVCFSEEEVWAVIKKILNDKAPGPDGFTGLFYKIAWSVIKEDLMNALNAFWSLDTRSFNLLNDAFMVLLRKKPMANQGLQAHQLNA